MISADRLRREGEFIDQHIVDESQTVSNAGNCEIWFRQGITYHITTWNHCAVEHKAGEETVTVADIEDED